jgi:hypothetical protein
MCPCCGQPSSACTCVVTRCPYSGHCAQHCGCVICQQWRLVTSRDGQRDLALTAWIALAQSSDRGAALSPPGGI